MFLRRKMSKTTKKIFFFSILINCFICFVFSLKIEKTFNCFCNCIERIFFKMNNFLNWLTSFRTCVVFATKRLLFFIVVSYLSSFNFLFKFKIRLMISSRCFRKAINISRNWTTWFLTQNFSCSTLLMFQTKIFFSTFMKTMINKKMIRRKKTWFRKKITRTLISKKLFNWLTIVWKKFCFETFLIMLTILSLVELLNNDRATKRL